MAENHLPPISVVQGRPLLLLGLVLVAVVWFFLPRWAVSFPPKWLSWAAFVAFVMSTTLIRVLAPMASGAVMFCISGNCLANAAISFASRICLARSSPNKSFDDSETLLEQIVWNSCFNDGLSCSRLIDEISETMCPTRALSALSYLPLAGRLRVL